MNESITSIYDIEPFDPPKEEVDAEEEKSIATEFAEKISQIWIRSEADDTSHIERDERIRKAVIEADLSAADISELVRKVKGDSVHAILDNLDVIEEIDPESVIALIVMGWGYDVMEQSEEVERATTGEVNADVLYEKLLRNGEGYTITEFVDRFSKDPAEIVAEMIAFGEPGYALKIALETDNLNGYDPDVLMVEGIENTSFSYALLDEYEIYRDRVDEALMLDTLFANNHIADTVKYAEKFRTSPQQITERVLGSRMRWQALRLVHLDVDMDEQEVVDWCLENGHYHQVTESLNDLAKVDFNQLARYYSNRFTSRIVCERLDCFGPLDTDVYIQLLRNDPSAFLSNLDLVAGELDMEMNSRFARNIADVATDRICSNYARYMRFGGLRKLYELDPQRVGEYAHLHGRDLIENAVAELKDEPSELRNLVELLKSAEVEIPEGVREAVEKSLNATRNERTHEERFALINLPREAFRFYIAESLLADLNMFEHVMENPNAKDPITRLVAEARELRDIRDRAKLTGVRHKLDSQIDDSYTWMKEYLFCAVRSEMRHQDGIFASQAEIGTSIYAGKNFVRERSPEEVRLYLKRSSIKFSQPGWSSQFGGKSWARISDLAYQAWLPDTQENTQKKAYIIDRAFDMEHNTGNIFDKDVRLERRSRLNSVLDFKFTARTVEELIDHALAQKYISAEEAQDYRTMKGVIDSLYSLPTRTKGYE